MKDNLELWVIVSDSGIYNALFSN